MSDIMLLNPFINSSSNIKIIIYAIDKIVDILSKISISQRKFISYINKFYKEIKDFLDIKKYIIYIIKKYKVIHINEDCETIIEKFLINHKAGLESYNEFSVKKTSLIKRFKINNDMDILRICNPKSFSTIVFEGSLFNYIYKDFTITFFHFNKNKLESLTKYVSEMLVYSLIGNNKYYVPYIYKTLKEKDQFSWSKSNFIDEDIKLFMSDYKKNKILDPFQSFFTKKDVYRKIGLQHKMVAVFEGNPGLGKTTTVKYLAQTHEKDIYIFDKIIENVDQFMYLYNNMRDDSIILFDDFDKTIVEYSNKPEIINMFLHVFDGVLTKSGSVIIICLNDFSVLEKCIPTVSRVGRIDLKINFNLFDKDDILYSIVKEIFEKCEDEKVEEYISLIKKTGNDTISDIKISCLLSEQNLCKAIENLKEEINFTLKI